MGEIKTTKELIHELKLIQPQGFEVSLKLGILQITKVVYFRKNKIFVYTNEFVFDFDDCDGLTLDEFSNQFESNKWEIEMAIN
jgi:hypothetical protein